MSVKIFLMRDEKKLCVEEPFSGADHAVVVDEACPLCGDKPFKIAGSGKHIATDDHAYEAEGYALCCKKHVGTIRAEVSTLFGLREDEAVLHGRPRVY